LRSLLVHAADLGECLNDPVILDRAEELAAAAGGDKPGTAHEPPSELLAMLG